MSREKRKPRKRRRWPLWLLGVVVLALFSWYGVGLWYDYEIGPTYDIPYVSRKLDLPAKPVAIEPWVRGKPCYPAPTQRRLPIYGGPKRYVIAVSIDGLRSDVLTKLGPTKLPTFFRLKREGASTLNARTDHDYTITLPNHIGMVTGRFVLGRGGHGYKHNKMPGLTIHQVKGSYVPSVFDWLHDRGMRTMMMASKRKFIGMSGKTTSRIYSDRRERI